MPGATVPRGRAKSARLRSRAGAHSRHGWERDTERCTAERPPPERKPVGRAQVPPNARDRPETGQRREVRDTVRDESRNTDRTRRRERAGRRGVLVAASTTPREGAREERHGSETQIGRRRPQQTEAERRCRSGEGGRIGRGCAPLRLKGRVIRSRIGRSFSQTSARRPKPWADLQAGTWAELPRESGPVERDSEKRPGPERPDHGATGTATARGLASTPGSRRWQRVRDPASDAALLRNGNRTTGERARRETSSMVQ